MSAAWEAAAPPGVSLAEPPEPPWQHAPFQQTVPVKFGFGLCWESLWLGHKIEARRGAKNPRIQDAVEDDVFVFVFL